MTSSSLFLSIKPVFANKILDGTKTIELRRIRPHVMPGQSVLIYSSSPEMSLVGRAIVENILCDTPMKLWNQVKAHAGISRPEYDAYFEGASNAIGLQLGQTKRFKVPIPLCELRARWPWFQPPQSYRFVRAEFEGNGWRVVGLEPG
ncbi:MAG: ASCH domain-containing protein [Polyangiaceae bacterium]|nr:ASCH domain-containing protein [Polyangiaceae bacterium]